MVKKIGIWRKDSNAFLGEVLSNGWDLVLAESSAGRKMGLGTDGHQIIFKDAIDKIPFIPKLEEEGWSIYGYDSFLLTGIPENAILKQIKGIFPDAGIFDVATHREIEVSVD